MGSLSGESGWVSVRKKPVVVTAMLLTDDYFNRPPDAVQHIPGLRCNPETHEAVIPTLEGDMTAHIGDWIICGVQGEFYPCDPDIFAATYEPAREGDCWLCDGCNRWFPAETERVGHECDLCPECARREAETEEGE